jgi:hypothetical protein
MIVEIVPAMNGVFTTHPFPTRESLRTLALVNRAGPSSGREG